MSGAGAGAGGGVSSLSPDGLGAAAARDSLASAGSAAVVEDFAADEDDGGVSDGGMFWLAGDNVKDAVEKASPDGTSAAAAPGATGAPTPQSRIIASRADHLVLNLSDLSSPSDAPTAASKRQRLDVEGSGPFGTIVDGDLGEWLRRLGPAQTSLLMRLRNRRGSALKCGGVSSPDGRSLIFALAGSHTLYEFSAFRYTERLSRIGSAELWRFTSGGRNWCGWWLAGTLNSSGRADGLAMQRVVRSGTVPPVQPSFDVPVDVCFNAVQAGVVDDDEAGDGSGDGTAAGGAGGAAGGAGGAPHVGSIRGSYVGKGDGSPGGSSSVGKSVDGEVDNPPPLDLFVADRTNRAVRHVVGRPGRARVTTVRDVLQDEPTGTKPERVASTAPLRATGGSTLWTLFSTGVLSCCTLDKTNDAVNERIVSQGPRFSTRTLTPLSSLTPDGAAVIAGVLAEPANSGNTDLVIVRRVKEGRGSARLLTTKLKLHSALDDSVLTLKRPMAVELPLKNVCAFAVVTSGRMCIACMPNTTVLGQELTLKTEAVPCGGDATGHSEDSYAMPWGEVRTLSAYTTGDGGLGLYVSDADARVFNVTFPAQLAARPTGHAVSMLPYLVDNEELCDVTFRVEGKTIHAVRALLAARSGYFRSMFFGGMRESLTPRASPSLRGSGSRTPSGRTPHARSKRPASRSGGRSGKRARRTRDSVASTDGDGDGDGDGVREAKTLDSGEEGEGSGDHVDGGDDDDEGGAGGDGDDDDDEHDVESDGSTPVRERARLEIEISDASYPAFRAMIAFLCTDALALPASDWVSCIVEVMCLATKYRLPSLYSACMEFMEQQRRLDPDSLIALMPAMLSASYERNLSQLCQYCINLMRSRAGRAWLRQPANTLEMTSRLAPHPELLTRLIQILL